VFTKSRLFKAKLASSDLCYLCLKTKQDLKHILVSCPVASEFWKIFLEWYETLTETKLEFSTVKILYGILSSSATQGQLVGAGKSLAGEKKIRAKKSQEGE